MSGAAHDPSDKDINKPLRAAEEQLNLAREGLGSSAADPAKMEQMRKTVGELQEALDYLRLSVKYLVFDLEATRRENADLRRQLREARGESEPGTETDPE